VFAHLERLGGGSMLDGVVAAVETGWFQGEIADAAYRFEKKAAAGRRVVVGVNRFTDSGDAEIIPTLLIGADVEERQRKRLAAVRAGRDPHAVDAALAAVRADAAHPDVNLVPAILAAVRVRASVGEVVGALGTVFGRWTEDAVI
jgi:methylmalonyl-CoA mutase, N-terminal domain